MRVLSSRFLRSWGRSPVHLVVQAAQYIIAALLLGARPRPLPPIGCAVTHAMPPADLHSCLLLGKTWLMRASAPCGSWTPWNARPHLSCSE